MTTTHLLYLHGFRSSPASTKARITAAAVAERFPHVTWLCPALPASPQEAMQGVERAIADWPSESMAIIGSSLGGFYATWLAEQCDCRAVLLNPAVNPARDLERHLGDNTVWHDPQQHFVFERRYIQELRDLQVTRITRPERYLAVIAKGDEVLDWREMAAHYASAASRLLPEGDHALSEYPLHLDAVLAFAGLTHAASADLT